MRDELTRAIRESTGTGVFVTGSGDELVPLEEFSESHIQPTRANKQLIQQRYVDLLYFEYRENVARENRQRIIFRVVASIALGAVIWAARNYVSLAVAATVVLALPVGFSVLEWFGSRDDLSCFARSRKIVEDQLNALGVGILRFGKRELTQRTSFDSAWDDPAYPYRKTDLGVVRPVFKDGGIDVDHGFDVFDDNVYR